MNRRGDLLTEVYGHFGIVRGINTQTRPDGSVIGRVRFTDLFAHKHRKWRALSAQETVLGSASREAWSLVHSESRQPVAAFADASHIRGKIRAEPFPVACALHLDGYPDL